MACSTNTCAEQATAHDPAVHATVVAAEALNMTKIQNRDRLFIIHSVHRASDEGNMCRSILHKTHATSLQFAEYRSLQRATVHGITTSRWWLRLSRSQGITDQGCHCHPVGMTSNGSLAMEAWPAGQAHHELS